MGREGLADMSSCGLRVWPPLGQTWSHTGFDLHPAMWLHKGRSLGLVAFTLTCEMGC